VRRILSAVVTLCLLASCGPVPNPQPPQPAPSWSLDVQVADSETVIANAQVRIVDGPNAGRTDRTDAIGRLLLTGLKQSGFTICASKGVEYQETCAGITLTSSQNVTLKLFRQWAAVTPVHSDGKVFRLENGQAWRWKGVSAFALLDRYGKGQDISDTLTAYEKLAVKSCNDASGCRYNLLRVWPYVPVRDWGASAWDAPPPDVAVAFVRAMAQKGWYVELTLLTDNDPARVSQAKALVAALMAAKLFVFLEIANEPEVQHSGNIDTTSLRATLEASGLPFSSGNYTDAGKRWFGSWINVHTQRDVEWPRRSHDCLDFWVHPADAPAGSFAIKAPCVLDEPAKLESVGGDRVNDWRAYFGSGAQFGAGATFHSQTGLYGLPPTPAELELAAAALEGLNAFPADTPLGPYRRIDGDGLRTYVIGESMVRIRPNRPTAPESGWTSLDSDGVLWRR
jgi:hypothetical protein